MDHLQEDIASAVQTLQRIRQEARQRRDEMGFDTLVSPAALASLQWMQQKAWADAQWPLARLPQPPGLRGTLVNLAQRVILRMLRWYIYPIVHQQNEFNQATLHAMQTLSNEILELRAGSVQERAGAQARLNDLTTYLQDLQHTLRGKNL